MVKRQGDEFIEQALGQLPHDPAYRRPSVTRPPMMNAPAREVGGYFLDWVMLFLGVRVGKGVSEFLIRAACVTVILIIFALVGLYQAISQWISAAPGVAG